MASSSSSSTQLSSETNPEMIDKRQIFHDNYIYIPERYFLRMIQTGLANQLVKVIYDINCEQNSLELYDCKRRSEHIDHGKIEPDIQPKKKFKEDVSTHTTLDFQPIFFGPNEDSYEESHPGYTYFTKSFYGSD